MRELIGMLLTTMVVNIMKVTGKAAAVGLSTSTAGIVIGTGIIELTIMITTTTMIGTR
jgi:hypothetical protein